MSQMMMLSCTNDDDMRYNITTQQKDLSDDDADDFNKNSEFMVGSMENIQRRLHHNGCTFVVEKVENEYVLDSNHFMPNMFQEFKQKLSIKAKYQRSSGALDIKTCFVL